MSDADYTERNELPFSVFASPPLHTAHTTRHIELLIAADLVDQSSESSSLGIAGRRDWATDADGADLRTNALSTFEFPARTS